MLYRRSLMVLCALLMGALVLTGCSDDSPVDLSGNNQDTATAAGFRPIPDLDEFMRTHGIASDGGVLAEKQVIFPPPLLVATQGTRAKGAVKDGTWWAPLTEFTVDDNGDVGFMVSWLEDDPDEIDPNRYICNVLSEVPGFPPVNPQNVAPYTGPITTATSNVINFLKDPQNALEMPVNEGSAFIYDYHFGYPDPAAPTLTYRIYRVTRFRLGIYE